MTRRSSRYSISANAYLRLAGVRDAEENLYLPAEACGCGVCAIAAYDDDALNSLLGLDGEKDFVIYLATVGKKRS